ncbi:hypothetical protein CDAR_424191 [Caerostris darwini]|uniref:Secreted protein n=1 Tax=Caerostris darwini TaxID=1538125 RepID=A0AAV4T0C7_9ARAC|nr:hypothetical protein CDAR_424191 [Caerostris darwini]
MCKDVVICNWAITLTSSLFYMWASSFLSQTYVFHPSCCFNCYVTARSIRMVCKRSTDKCPDAANALLCAHLTPRSETASDTTKSFQRGKHTARKMGLKSPPFDLAPD